MQQPRSDRLAHQVQVRFWTKGEEAIPLSGHTRDLSTTGMFISTKSPYPPGTRFILETVDSPGRLQAEAEVVHYIGTLQAPGADGGESDTPFVAAAPRFSRESWANAISPFLHRLRPSGMGVRFLLPVPGIREMLGIESADQAS